MSWLLQRWRWFTRGATRPEHFDASADWSELARCHAVLRSLADAVVLVRPDGVIAYQTPAVERVFGYRSGELVGSQVTDWAHPSDAPRVRVYLAEAVCQSGASAPTEWRLRHRDGSWRHVETVGSSIVDHPLANGVVLASRDVSARKQLEQQLAYQAFHDSLTGLPNRSLFADRLDHALVRRRRYNGSLALLYIDLDDFKAVNDSLGHAAGDQLLVALSGRLESCLRTGDTAARLSGDEFAILLEDTVDAVDASDVAERILEALREPFGLGGNEVFVRASIGIAASSSELGADELLRNADVALYSAKSNG
jgi:diguanylate cyclase (GGDEF)-like protein/PAS domain S-box-containing protein